MNSLRQLYRSWKSLRLPWRRQFLAGQDLHGLTYWELLGSNPNRPRRIVKGPRTLHHSDVQAAISPLWHQWLRHTRADPPSLEEQHGDVQRLVELTANARLADERWNSKRRYIERPKEKDEEQSGTRGIEAQRSVAEDVRGKMEERAGLPPDAAVDAVVNQDERETVGDQGRREMLQQQELDPWEQERQRQKQAATNPSGTWQPESWTPPPRRR